MIRLFDGHSGERMDELDERKLRRPLVKTHLLEVLDHHNGQLTTVLNRQGIELLAVDESLFLVKDPGLGEIGFVETLGSRVLALYSIMKSDELSRWVRHLVLGSPELDHVWLSGLTFNVLWQLVCKLSRPHRYSRIVFTHDSIFEIDSQIQETDDEESSSTGDDEEIIERRATRFQLVDRIETIKQKLEKLQELYSPLYAISQLRFPSPVGRGGHDFYDNGRVTNRSDSFLDHRNHLLFVVRIYEQLLKRTEDAAWYSIKDSVSIPGQFKKIVGAPVTIRFQEPLPSTVFDYWIKATFDRSRNKFRLWGHPIRLGPTKVHVYGVDRHLWQPIFLEMSAKGCVAIIPNGTCGNTIHRLVTNIQRYLDPGAHAFIGDKRYQDLVTTSAEGIPYGSE